MAMMGKIRAMMKDQYEQTGLKQHPVGEFSYAAQSWPHERRVITQLEWGDQGFNPRFVVTNLSGDAAVAMSISWVRGERLADPGSFLMFTRIHGGTDKNVDPGFGKLGSTIGLNVLECIPSSAKLSGLVQTREAAIFPLTPTGVATPVGAVGGAGVRESDSVELEDAAEQPSGAGDGGAIEGT